MTAVIFLFVFGLGIVAVFKPSFWAVLLSLVAFLPSSALFYGTNDYAIRAGMLSWIFLSFIPTKNIGQKRNFMQILLLWFVMASGGLTMTYVFSKDLYSPLIKIFTYSGFSLTYVLLIGLILRSNIKIKKFMNMFIIFAVLFYSIGGIFQLIIGHQLRPNNEAAFFLNDSNNYFTLFGRMTGIFETSSHATATVLNIVFSFLLAKILFENDTKLKFNIFLLVLTLVGIVLCQNRGNYIPVAVLLLMTSFHLKGLKKVTPILITIGVSIVAFIVYPMIKGDYDFARLGQNDNILTRLDIYQNAYKNFSFIFTNYVFGIGYFDIASLGGTTSYYTYIFALFGENQILNWIITYGWLVTILIVLIIGKQFYHLTKLLQNVVKNEDKWFGYGLFYSWISLFLVFMPNFDTRSLIPLIYALTGIWFLEVKDSNKSFEKISGKFEY